MLFADVFMTKATFLSYEMIEYPIHIDRGSGIVIEFRQIGFISTAQKEPYIDNRVLKGT